MNININMNMNMNINMNINLLSNLQIKQFEDLLTN